MRKRLDLTGQRFGKLTFLCLAEDLYGNFFNEFSSALIQNASR